MSNFFCRVIPLVVVVLLVGCGQSGPLYMPSSKEAPHVAK